MRETSVDEHDVKSAILDREEVADPVVEAVATPLDALLGTGSWRDLEGLLGKAMTDFFQLPFTSTATRDLRVEPFVAEVSLSEPAQQLELGLSVVVDTDAMKRLGAALLGDEDREGAEALILEVANILMGTLKTAFTAHGFTFIGGIPTTESFVHSRSLFDASPARSRTAITAQGNDVELWLRAKVKRNTTILGRALVEGLVIGDDVRDPRGMLLIKGGSRLTRTSAEQLSELVPDLAITVSDPTR